MHRFLEIRPALLLAALIAAPLAAQQPGAPGSQGDAQRNTQPSLDLATNPGTMGSSSGFLSIFDNGFNPAFGVAFDVVSEFAGARNGAGRYNRLRARSVEINAASRIDPLGWAYMTLSSADKPDGTHVELEEGAVWLDHLPHDFTLRAGRYLADFGKWNPFHTHDKPYVNEDPVRREFLGGPLFLTGVELHQWFGFGDVPMRWSLGLASGAEGDDHDVAAQDNGVTPFGRRSLDSWTATGRLSAQYDVGTNGYFQWGWSGLYTPGALEFTDPNGIPNDGDEQRLEVRKALNVIDLTLRTVDASAQTSHTLSAEFWHHRGQFDDGVGGLASGPANGVWGFYERRFSPYWAAGLFAAWYERMDAATDTWFQGADAGDRRGLFLTWNLSEFNRLRLQVAHTAPADGSPDFFALAAQWTVILGSHHHSIDW